MNKTYTLTKELPTFETGTKAFLDNDGNLIAHLATGHVAMYMRPTLEKFPDILTDWFVEVKIEQRWRAHENEPWYYTSLFGGVKSNLSTTSNRAEKLYQHGNMFRNEATAAVVGRAQKLFFKWLHDKEASVIALGRDDSTRELTDSMDRARAAVLEGDRNA